MSQREFELKQFALREIAILKHETELDFSVLSPVPTSEKQRMSRNPRRVFVVHGRNSAARDVMFSFLRMINLEPMEWSEAVALTGQGSPFIGDILDKAFEEAQAVVVLITGDDLARLGTRFQKPDDEPYEMDLTPQARPNVLFEAGMAFGRQPERTILEPWLKSGVQRYRWPQYSSY